MKRIRTVVLLLIIGILPFSLALGQEKEKKNEKKVKVIIADKSGTTVIIDTSFAGTDKIDSVVIKDGNVIYIGKNDPEISVKSGKQYKVITHVERDGESTGHRYVYVNDDKVVSSSGEDVFDIMVTDDDFDSDTDRTKYVISKNGITVYIEGDDEAKVKEIISEIEKKLDVNIDEKKPAVKEGEKDTVKKK